jgi:hypothetical protein
MNLETTYKVIISQDGEIKKTFENEKNDFCALRYLLQNQCQSTDYALRHGGWKVELINEQTGESDFWKPYTRINN